MAFRHEPAVKRTGHLIDWMVGESLHAKRVQSVTNAVVGVVNAVSLSIHAIGTERDEGLVAIYKDGPVFEVAVFDSAGRPRPD